MKIEKITDDYYRVRKQVKGQKITLIFRHKPTQKEIALALAEQIDAHKEKGTFEEYARKYISERSNVLSPSSVSTYTNLINVISDSLKSKNLYDITQSDIQVEINNYSATHSPKSTRSLHGFIASILGIYRPNFTLRTTLPQKVVKPSNLPSEAEIKLLLDHVKDTEDSIAIQLGILSLRRAEIAALVYPDDLNGNELTINKVLVYNKGWKVKPCAKTDASNRIVYLPDSLVNEIHEKGYFFKYSPNKLNAHLKKYQADLGLKPFVFHSLRHFFASYAHSIGIPDAEVMALGGWKSDFVFRSIYREAFENKKKESAKKLSGIIG